MLERLFPQQADDKLFVEDVFSTYLYTGNGSTQTITNGINLSGQGGMVWTKSRTSGATHALIDTVRGVNQLLSSPSAAAQVTNDVNQLYDVSSTGYRVANGDFGSSLNNLNGINYASWTFREAPKFFDVVTYTGNSTNNRSIAHNLGVAPGMIIIKKTSGADDWVVYHRSLSGQYLVLNTTAAASTLNVITADATTFTLPTAYGFVNGDASNTYVAYLFAHNTASDGFIQCGSYTGTSAAGNAVTLGWEPQWVLIKNTTNAQFWGIYDNMRGMPVGSNDALLQPNTASAEQSYEAIEPTATGFRLMNGSQDTNASGNTYIYMAIRRGPMRTPTLGTSVLSVKNYAATTTSASVTHDVTFDVEINANRDAAIAKFLFVDSLRGINGVALQTASVVTEVPYPTYWSRNGQRGMSAVSGFDGWWASSSGTNNHVSYGLVRAPGFMDVVCYTGNGTANQSINHSLGVTPELVIVKRRSASVEDWYAGRMSGGIPVTEMRLNTNAASVGNVFVFPVSQTQITVNYTNPVNGLALNSGGETYVAYLFASVPGVSKVGTYTGNGSSQTINCAFTTGARFVLIKRTDGTGDWYVWDSARGIVAGNDPYLALNSTAAEVTSNDSVDADSTGFVVNQVAASNINVNAATYIYLAIA
jgi:hypothetical protein